ncbi:MAG TPA: hypothetical protein VE262_03105 [Blastocatellia bacterium]|nr:hypothetical protein [Blastocatellia bacterium]
MIGCKQVKRFVDEADNPALLPYEAASHLDSCAPCKQFAQERATLRELLASTERVSAPVNFDAVLRARLAERVSSRTPAWLAPAFLFRFGAATAVLAVAIIAAGTGGLFTGPQTGTGEQARLAEVKQPESNKAGGSVATALGQPDTAPEVVTGPSRAQSAQTAQVRYSRVNPRTVRGGARDLNGMAAREVSVQDGAVVLVRGKDGEREMPMPTVSVGAQSLLYQNAGRPVVSHVRASF